MSEDRVRPGEKRLPRVLLVDDHPDTTELLGMLLSRRGFAVTTADSMAAALAAAQAASIDVLVSDIHLPDGSGYELLRHLRTTNKLPAIALSGRDGEDDIRRGREAGFDEYLCKPVRIAVLVDVLQRLAPEGA